MRPSLTVGYTGLVQSLPTIPRPKGAAQAGPAPEVHPLRLEMAAAAARLIADSGLDYASAKRRAMDEVLDGRQAPRSVVPDNREIDQALAEHLDLFDPEHASRVERMRRVALALMRRLADCQPYLTGAVWKGIVAEHAPIHLQLFHDDPKQVEMRLLDDGIDFEADEVPHFRDGARSRVEALMFTWQNEPVMVSLYAHDDLRGALRGDPPERGDVNAVTGLLDATQKSDEAGR